MTRTAAGTLSFSVIVASQHRISWLKRCLTAIRQLDFPNFEIVVVADETSIAAVEAHEIKTATCREPNLSLARNLGIAAAAGDVCAFIDDDSVPEPLWLAHLERAFSETGATAVAGFVRGRNGISFQSMTQSVDAEAETHEELFPGWEPCVPMLKLGRALKLVGTNMAIRRDALLAIGGFDESMCFFLEDTDLSFRLAKSGARLAISPLAQVHHGFAASERRTGLRAPLDLFDIGRSSAIYLRKHLGRADADIRNHILRRERNRLVRHMVAGNCEPRHVDSRTARFSEGWDVGCGARLGIDATALGDTPASPFLRFPARPSGHSVVASRWRLKRRALLRNAERIVGTGGRASVFSFSLTPFRHHVVYHDSGFWLQTGGVYGKTSREDTWLRWCRFARRLGLEIRRVAMTRGIVETATVKWWDQMRGKRREFESEDTQ
ncbi:MAG: glycosyltransferase family 2 protein [Silicimonas sp.]|nr:glycosyltransferase family 2 protein [Silicimonas sp.]